MTTQQIGDLERALQEGDVDASQEEGSAEGQEQTSEELDYKALWEQEKTARELSEASRKKAEDDARAQRIQQLTQKQRDERLERIEKLVEDIDSKKDSGHLDAVQAKAELRKGMVAIEEQAGDPAVEAGIVEEFQTLYGAVTGFKDASREEMAGVIQWYERGKDAYLRGNAELARAYLTSSQTAFELVKERKAPPARPSAAALALNQRASSGGGGGMSDQVWLDRYSDEEKGGIPSTPENRKRGEELWAKGLRPRPVATR